MISNIKKKYFSNIILPFACLFFAQNLFAQNTTVSVDKKDILIGEQITLYLNVTHTAADKVAFLLPDSFPHFDVILQKKLDTIDTNAQPLTQQKIVFTSFDSGSWTMPAIKYSVNNITAFTDSFKVNVGYLATDTSTTIHDIKSIITVPYFNWLWVWGAAALIVSIIVAYLIYKFINNKKLAFTASKNIDPFKYAMLELDKLHSANEAAAISVKEYHTTLGNIFKNYCGSILHQNYFTNTTSEVLNKLKLYAINAETTAHTFEALKTGDATKFAKYSPSFSENQTALNYIKNTIVEIEQSRNKKANS